MNFVFQVEREVSSLGRHYEDFVYKCDDKRFRKMICMVGAPASLIIWIVSFDLI